MSNSSSPDTFTNRQDIGAARSPCCCAAAPGPSTRQTPAESAGSELEFASPSLRRSGETSRMTSFRREMVFGLGRSRHERQLAWLRRSGSRSTAVEKSLRAPLTPATPTCPSQDVSLARTRGSEMGPAPCGPRRAVGTADYSATFVLRGPRVQGGVRKIGGACQRSAIQQRQRTGKPHVQRLTGKFVGLRTKSAHCG